MRSPSAGHAGVGAASSLLGVAGIASGIMRPAWLDGAFLDTPVWALFVTGGGVLLLSGAFVLIFTFRGKEEDANIVPAHVAFRSRMTAEPILPPLRATPPANVTANAATPAVEPARKLAAPAPLPQQRLPPVKDDMQHVDSQIRELTRQINKAGVMLATGQLSQQGYLAYVEDLKRQRGKLEVQKVRAELRST